MSQTKHTYLYIFIVVPIYKDAIIPLLVLLFVSYFFIYLYVKLKINGMKNLIYILIWCSFSVFIEWIGVKIGLYHYNKGYKMYWSFPVYMFVQSVLISYYHAITFKK